MMLGYTQILQFHKLFFLLFYFVLKTFLTTFVTCERFNEQMDSKLFMVILNLEKVLN
jgi:hypothetical protein